MPSDSDAIKITAEDLASVSIPVSPVASPVAPSSGSKVYGTINETAEQFVTIPAERGSILLQGWFYLGLAGLLGALAGWAIAEPGFADPPVHGQTHWGNILLFPRNTDLNRGRQVQCHERLGGLLHYYRQEAA